MYIEISIKQDLTPVYFEETYQDYLQKYQDLGLDFLLGEEGNPTLDDMRGKVVLLDGWYKIRE